MPSQRARADCRSLCFGEVSRAWLVTDPSGALAGGVGLNRRGYPNGLVLGQSSPVIEIDVKFCNLIFCYAYLGCYVLFIGNRVRIFSQESCKFYGF